MTRLCSLLTRALFLAVVAVWAAAVPASAQAPENVALQVTPAELTLEVGASAQLEAAVVDARGTAVTDSSIVFYSRDRRAVSTTRGGTLTAHQPGAATIVALRPAQGGIERLQTEVTVTVPYPPIETIAFTDTPREVYADTRVALDVTAIDATGAERDEVAVDLTSSAPDIASVDGFGTLHAHQPGSVRITARAEGAVAQQQVRVVENPVVTLELRGGRAEARTGDVLDFDAVALDADGNAIEDLPVRYTMQALPDDNLGPGASGQIDADGKFVAEEPGRYTIVASSGTRRAQQQVRIVPRNVSADIEVVGRGHVQDVHTSDLWVWEAQDGRDYALTGTWGANGATYFWDVTDPATITPVDTVVVDARTVNDVKVSADGTLCIIGREGASDRKNGIVLLDCTDPTDVRIITEYTQNLTGGVHNLFIYEDHIYALSAGRRYHVINIEDPSTPQQVSTVELDTPGHSIHDVWVERGIAFSSNWDDGVVLTDVGNGMAGGSPSNPQRISSYAYPSGWNHAAFPYRDEETGTFYVIAGDEAFPKGLYVEDRPTEPAGYLHFIDFTDMDDPEEVARYQVPEAGSHNYWVKDDTLYVAYYNAGLRVVDLSGELMGNLYEQGREIAAFKPFDPEGTIPNAPMTWGPQPHKGHIFISDWNSGLWALKLESRPQESEPTP